MPESTSPFHRGERSLQDSLGVREQMESFGRRVIRDHLPDQHRAFYQQQYYLFLSHVDGDGWPWASMLFSPHDFIQSPDKYRLVLDITPMEGDPLNQSLREQLDVGVLGIELHSRRRNRISAVLKSLHDGKIELSVKQSFGNCPQYIQQRYWQSQSKRPPKAEFESFKSLDQEAQQLIAAADTFFVASYAKTDESEASNGADISHRGGKPGFVRVESDGLLTIPDYLGNFHFNTLGNFLENPKAGLLFIDFQQGHILQLTGTTEVLMEAEELEYFQGAERLWTFRPSHGRWLRHCLPKSWRIESASPNNRLTGTWREAEQQRLASNHAKQWQRLELTKRVDESELISSFYLTAPAGQLLSRFQAGQFLTLRAEVNGVALTRNYTVSSAPGDDFYRISVKRQGQFSNFLHHQLELGDCLEVLPPQGDFSLDTAAPKPALLLAAGIGITPMIAFIRHSLNEAVRTRKQRQITLVVQIKSRAERSFYPELEAYQQASQGKITVFWYFSQEQSDDFSSNEKHGRLNKGGLSRLVEVNNSQAYLCGTADFMQSVYQQLSELGLADTDVLAESFGPASLLKHSDKITPAADNASVQFVQGGQELSHHLWQTRDGSLLEFAEQHGLQPLSACRSGRCGSCRAQLREGQVSYGRSKVVEHKSNEVLLCCAKPAVGSAKLMIELYD